MLAYLNVGGLGTAFYRLSYVKTATWVKYKIGEKVLLSIVCLVTLGISTLTVILFGIGPGQRANLNICLGKSSGVKLTCFYN